MINCYKWVDDFTTINEGTRYEKRVKSGSHVEAVEVKMPLGCLDSNGRVNERGQRYLDMNGYMRQSIIPENLLDGLLE